MGERLNHDIHTEAETVNRRQRIQQYVYDTASSMDIKTKSMTLTNNKCLTIFIAFSPTVLQYGLLGARMFAFLYIYVMIILVRSTAKR